MPTAKIPEKLEPVFAPKRYKILIGGRGSAKSTSVAYIMLSMAQTQGAKILCAREFQNSIEDSVYSLMCDLIKQHDLQGFNIQANAIYYPANGAEIKFRGLARNPHSVKSLHGFNVLWGEEAQTFSEQSLQLITPTLREAGSELWFTANPQSSADPFSQRFIIPFQKEINAHGVFEDDLHTIVKINYKDNPWFPQELEKERAYDYEHRPRALYNHIWLGAFNDSIENSIIPAEWFDAAIDAHVKLGFKPEGAIIASYDPADEGKNADAKGFALRHGSVVLDVAQTQLGDVNEGTDWAINRALDSRADWFIWDGDGMGVALKRQISQALEGKRGIDFWMFRGSEMPEQPDAIYESEGDSGKHKNKTNRETFKNRRAQFYWKLRDRFYATYRAVEQGAYSNPDNLISLSSKIDCLDALRAEVCRIPLKRNNNGRIQIMSKIEMAKLGIPSPNMADSLMQAMFSPPSMAKYEPINFKGWG